MAYLVGAGVTLSRRTTASPAAYTAISQVKDVTPPQLELGTVETTHLLSAAREFMPTIHDGGEVSFNLEFDPADAQHMALDTSWRAKTVETWRITMDDEDGTLIDFTGFITTFGIDQLTVDSVVMIPCAIRITGLPTITVPA